MAPRSRPARRRQIAIREAGGWWAVTDLNRGPSRCKRDALTAELTAQFLLIVTDAERSVNVRRGAPRPDYFTEKRYKLMEWYVLPAFSSLDGKLGWFGESG